MTIKPKRDPYGFKNLLVYKKAEELQSEISRLVHLFPKTKTLLALADQMERSARSTKQNIVEGWKRNSTKEYYEFLGFSIGSNAELEEDCTDIWKGLYQDLMGIKGIMGGQGKWVEMGEKSRKRIMGGNGKWGEEKKVVGEGKGGTGETGAADPHYSPSSPYALFDIERIPFYPLDPLLPLVVQAKLRAKELNFLLEKLQKSLVSKMSAEHTLPVFERRKLVTGREKEFDKWLNEEMAKSGLIRLPDGRVVSKDSPEARDN